MKSAMAAMNKMTPQQMAAIQEQVILALCSMQYWYLYVCAMQLHVNCE